MNECAKSSPNNRRSGVPTASSMAARNRMLAAKPRDTAPEKLLRSALHKMGLRYRVHVAPLPDMRSRADIVFPRARVVVFVDGCFWHGCPIHGTWPKKNAEWWRAKIEANKERDEKINLRLSQAGWTVVRIWEHEDPDSAAERVGQAVSGR